MTQLLLTTLGANGQSPLGAIEQHDPIEEGHLAQVLNLHSHLLLYFYLHLDRFTVGAPSLLMLPVPTKGTLPRPLAFALMHLVPLLSTAEAPDLVWVTIHEDWHFCWSSDTWDERCRLGGRVYRGREGPLQLILDQTVEVGVLDMVLGGDQILLDDEILCNGLAPFVRLGPLRTLMLRYCRNVRPTWVKFDSKDTKESGVVFEVLSTKSKKRT